MGESHSRWGGVAKRVFDVPTLHADQQTKRFPCSMGMLKLIFATPLERECRFDKLLIFCCGCWWIWGRENVDKMKEPVRF